MRDSSKNKTSEKNILEEQTPEIPTSDLPAQIMVETPSEKEAQVIDVLAAIKNSTTMVDHVIKNRSLTKSQTRLNEPPKSQKC